MRGGREPSTSFPGVAPPAGGLSSPALRGAVQCSALPSGLRRQLALCLQARGLVSPPPVAQTYDSSVVPEAFPASVAAAGGCHMGLESKRTTFTEHATGSFTESFVRTLPG